MENCLFCAVFCRDTTLYQDRLGTNTQKLNERWPGLRFLAETVMPSVLLAAIGGAGGDQASDEGAVRIDITPQHTSHRPTPPLPFASSSSSDFRSHPRA
jgi:hypothetical protein